MSQQVEKKTQKSNEKIAALVPDIVDKKQNRIGSVNKMIFRTYLKSISKIHEFDNKLNVNDDCVSCGICRDICPAKNIEICDGATGFRHQCECCLACLHHCQRKQSIA